MVVKIDTMLKEANFDELDHDVKGQVYEGFLNGYNNNAGKDFGQYFSPRAYIKLIFDHTPQDQVKRWKKKIDKGRAFTVLDPCMGTGGFLTEAFTYFGLDSSMLFGHEIDAKPYTYALMNMILTTGNLNSTNFTRYNSLTESDPRVEFNFIPTNPPYGTKMNYVKLKVKYEAKWANAIDEDDEFPTWNEIFPFKTNDGVALFLQYIAFKLKPGGMALAIVPNGQILFGKNFAKLRKYLMTQVDIVQIMYTPGGVFKHAGVKTAVIWMRRPRKGVLAEAPVKFMETTKQLTKPTPISEISFDEMEENNWSWDASYYKAQEIPNWDCEWKPLGEITTMKGGKYTTKGMTNTGEYPCYASAFKNPKGTHDKFCFDHTEYILFGKSGGSAQNPISRSLGIGKVFYVEGKVAANTDVVSIIVDEDAGVETKYLFRFLDTNQPKIQKMGRYSTSLGHIDMTAFKKFKIPVPSLEIQARIVAELDELDATKDGIRSTITGLKSALKKFRRHVNPPFGEYRDQIEWKPLGEVCEIEYGTRITKKKDSGSLYDAYGGGDLMAYKVDRYNRDGITYKISRDGMSRRNCVQKITGKFFMNDTAMSISSGDPTVLLQKFTGEFMLNIRGKIYDEFTNGGAQLHIDIAKLQQLKIPVLPLEIQAEFVEFYEDKEEEIKRMMEEIAILEARIVRLDDLGRSVIKNMICE
jgi:type I restriction enzyme S subunit